MTKLEQLHALCEAAKPENWWVTHSDDGSGQIVFDSKEDWEAINLFRTYLPKLLDIAMAAKEFRRAARELTGTTMEDNDFKIDKIRDRMFQYKSELDSAISALEES